MTQSGTDVFRVLTGRSNAYLVVNGDRAILADTGIASAYPRLISHISRTGIQPKDLQGLLLTHTHFDHCQSAKRLQKDFGCRVIASSAAAEFTGNGYAPLPAGTMPVTRQLSQLGRAIGKLAFGYSPFQADMLTNGDYAFETEFSGLRTINTRGHSEDSLSLIVDNEIAIVGDILFGVFRHSVYPHYADDPTELLRSWQKLLSSGCRLFLPGHGHEISHVRLASAYKRTTERIQARGVRNGFNLHVNK